MLSSGFIKGDGSNLVCIGVNMLEALLGGKLSKSQENMEDVLTSIVFGAFRREDASIGLLPFLKMSIPQIGSIPLPPDQECTVKYDDYEFWPPYEKIKGVAFCEPDVVITITVPDGKDILLLVEAKFHSGISSIASDDDIVSHQLAKEWLQLCNKASDDYIPWLIYLTTDIAAPYDVIKEAKDEIDNKIMKHNINTEPNISWLSWRVLGDMFMSKNQSEFPPTLNDISKIIRRLNLIYFNGFRGYKKLSNKLNYNYLKPSINFIWQYKKLPNSGWKMS
jgi:hypothetical protein